MRGMVHLSYALLFLLFGVASFIPIPVHVQLLVSAVLTIYIGAHRSLLNIEEESLTMNDAGMFPVFGSCMLLGLYIVFKLFDAYYVNFLLKAYFMAVGTFALSATICPLVRAVQGKRELLPSGRATEDREKRKKHLLIDRTIPLPQLVSDEPLEIQVDSSELVSVVLSVAVGVWYLTTKHWCASNVFGVCFSIQAIQQISLGSYKVGACLLIGLFFYDIFWVFGTDVMVTVAKSFDAPIKLLYPRAFATADTAAQFSMLGLGDIVMPGIFIALLLRYDLRRAHGKPCTSVMKRATMDFNKPMFNICLIAYELGLIVTVLVMYIWEAAQPALLYLVPACLLASLGAAAVRGELTELMAFEDTTVVAPKEEDSSAPSDKPKATAR